MAPTSKLLIASCTPLLVFTLFSARATAQTVSTQRTGDSTVTTEQMSGEVVQVSGNNLVVKMTNGEFRTFSNVPDSRRASIDGKEVGVRDLKPGTKLTATITKTTTPVTVRTTTVQTGRVWMVNGNTVILTLPNGENKQYTVRPDFTFVVNGAPATAHDLRPGMTVSAEKIVEEPTVEIAMNTRVIGQAPAASGTSAAASSAPPAASQTSRASGSASASAAPQGQAPARSTSAPAAGGGSQSTGTATLPKTGSQLPLVGLLGLMLLAGAFTMRVFRQSW